MSDVFKSADWVREAAMKEEMEATRQRCDAINLVPLVLPIATDETD